jgi:SAM-dependent methyltransferase
VLDLACSVGRTTHDLASRLRTPVVGLDLNFSMLRVARRALREGRVSYARRASGLVYEERSFAVPAAPGTVEFICADALALPFREGTFGLAVSLNLLDCLASPLDHLRGVRDVLEPGGSFLLATPFDWSPSTTPVEAWIGGHSPRGPTQGRPEAVLRSLLGGGHPVAVPDLALLETLPGLDWFVRLHDRAVMRYDVDLFVIAKRSEENKR